MWGRATGDPAMEARGNLMLAVQARSFRHYFLMENDNTIQPSNFIANKVPGIVSTIIWHTLEIFLNQVQLFENKVDHVTYFGANIEYIQGYCLISFHIGFSFSKLYSTR